MWKRVSTLVSIYAESEVQELNRFLTARGFPSFRPGRQIEFKDPVLGKGRHVIEEQWFLPRSDIERSKMLYVIQRFHRKGEQRIRIGYYIMGKKKRVRKSWLWGQFCPWYRVKDIANLLPLLKKLSTLR
jgi:hypothetical protein